MTEDTIGQQPASGAIDPELLRRLPKVDLHLHLAGTLRPATLAELVTRHGFPLPRPQEQLYVYSGFYDFIDVLRLAANALRTPDDIERMVYECMQDAASAGARHVEMSFNPQYYLPAGVSYRMLVDALVSGLRAAQKDFDCSGLLIAAIDRGLPMDSAERTMDDILSYRHELVVGVGLDGPERDGPPRQMAALWQRAGAAGLKRTAHVCEDNQTLEEAPPSNVHDCLHLMGCDRLDHGYNLLASEADVAHARRRGVYFCVCGITSVFKNRQRRHNAIRAMAEAGLPLTLNTDDPAMFHTNLTHTYQAVLQGCGWGWHEACKFSLAGVDACWLDDVAKRELRARFEREIAELTRLHEQAVAATGSPSA